jgi:FMN phosphatase YigB (HAD superfamily)
MLIFFDFDDVLFNTKKFKDDYFELFKRRGVSKKIFEFFYYDLADTRKTKTYSPKQHVKRVCDCVPLDYRHLEVDIMKFLQDTSSYVFKDVVNCLKNFSKKELHLISFSKTNFQKMKISNSGVAKYFNQIKIVDELKGSAIKKSIKDKCVKSEEKIYFIDDRVEHLKDAKIKNPEITTIFFLRKEGRHRDRANKYCDYSITDIKKIFEIITLNQKNVQKRK